MKHSVKNQPANFILGRVPFLASTDSGNLRRNHNVAEKGTELRVRTSKVGIRNSKIEIRNSTSNLIVSNLPVASMSVSRFSLFDSRFSTFDSRLSTFDSFCLPGKREHVRRLILASEGGIQPSDFPLAHQANVKVCIQLQRRAQSPHKTANRHHPDRDTLLNIDQHKKTQSAHFADYTDENPGEIHASGRVALLEGKTEYWPRRSYSLLFFNRCYLRNRWILSFLSARFRRPWRDRTPRRRG